MLNNKHQFSYRTAEYGISNVSIQYRCLSPSIAHSIIYTSCPHFALTFCPQWCQQTKVFIPSWHIISFGFPCSYFAYYSMDFRHMFLPEIIYMLSRPSLSHFRKRRILQAAAVIFCDGRTVPKHHWFWWLWRETPDSCSQTVSIGPLSM